MSIHSVDSQYSDASIRFDLRPSDLEQKDRELYERLLDEFIMNPTVLQVESFRRKRISVIGDSNSNLSSFTNKLRDTISSHSSLSMIAVSKKPSVFDCIKGRGPFQIVCSTNTDYALSGYGREIQIQYRHEDLFFMGYSVAILDWVYRNKENAWNEREGTYLPVLVRANNAASDGEFEKILQDRKSLESMVAWFKDFAKDSSQYTFDEKGLLHIEQMFNELGFFVSIAKQKQKFSICFKSEPEFDEVFQAEQSYGELIVRGKTQVSYFSG